MTLEGSSVPARRNNHFRPFPNVHHDGNRMDTQPTNSDGVLFVLYLPSKYEARIQHTLASLSNYRHEMRSDGSSALLDSFSLDLILYS